MTFFPTIWSNVMYLNIIFRNIWKNPPAKPNAAYVPTTLEHLANILTHGVCKLNFTTLFAVIVLLYLCDCLYETVFHDDRCVCCLRFTPCGLYWRGLRILPNFGQHSSMELHWSCSSLFQLFFTHAVSVARAGILVDFWLLTSRVIEDSL